MPRISKSAIGQKCDNANGEVWRLEISILSPTQNIKGYFLDKQIIAANQLLMLYSILSCPNENVTRFVLNILGLL